NGAATLPNRPPLLGLALLHPPQERAVADAGEGTRLFVMDALLEGRAQLLLHGGRQLARPSSGHAVSSVAPRRRHPATDCGHCENAPRLPTDRGTPAPTAKTAKPPRAGPRPRGASDSALFTAVQNVKTSPASSAAAVAPLRLRCRLLGQALPGRHGGLSRGQGGRPAGRAAAPRGH